MHACRSEMPRMCRAYIEIEGVGVIDGTCLLVTSWDSMGGSGSPVAFTWSEG